MSVEDRVRTAAEATAAAVRELPPLAWPANQPGRAPGRARRRAWLQRPWRSAWGGWLVPLAAAVAVIAVAASLVAVRSLGAGPAAPAPAPAVTGSVPASLPRYGVVLTQTTAKMAKKWGGGDVPVSDLSVIDTRTGQQVAQVKHPADFGFGAVSAAADDRTFVAAATSYNLAPLPGTSSMADVDSFYLLRIAPGSAQPAKLTRLSIPVQPGDATINGFALSPDGRTLAVMEWCTTPGPCYRGSPGTLQLYSVATGKAERTWTWGALPYPIPGYGPGITSPSTNGAGLTWLAGGRTLAFTYYAHGHAPVIRTLDTTQPGGELVASSRPVFTVPARGPGACVTAQLTADGRTVICAAQPAKSSCPRATLEIDAYSVATGKRTGVLYRYTAPCTMDSASGLLAWAGPGDAVVVTLVAGPGTSPQTAFAPEVIVGVLNHGQLVRLRPSPLVLAQAPGAAAF